MTNILFADRDTRYAAILRRWSEPQGISFSFLSDANKIATVAHEIHPKAIVCSLRVEHEDGFQFVQRVHEDEYLRTIPCIILTDLADRLDIRRCRSLGCLAYFIKRHTKPEYLFAYLRRSGYLD